MNPAEHVLVALLPVVAYSLLRHRRLPDSTLVLVALFAGLFADLVDKPLSWTFGLTPSGRMVAHSLVISLPLVVGVLVVADRSGYLDHGVVFAWGHLTHIAGDFALVLSHGSDYYFYPNLFWPLLEASPDRAPGFGSRMPALGIGILPELVAFALVLGYTAFDVGRKLRRRADPY